MSWIKLNESLLTSPKLARVTSHVTSLGNVTQCNAVTDHVTMALLRVWMVANKHADATGDFVPFATAQQVDIWAGVPGIAEAMVIVGWLVVEENGCLFPNFSENNKPEKRREYRTAKTSAQRQAEYRARKAAATGDVTRDVTGDVTGDVTVTQSNAPREEKRREEKIEDIFGFETEPKASAAKKMQRPAEVSETVWNDFVKLRQSKKSPLTPTALAGIASQAQLAGWTLEAALGECCERGWQGFKAEWVAGASKPGQPSQPGKVDRGTSNSNYKLPDDYDSIV